ncbi:inositol monophosphatase family protein [Puerhibacterium puerhi]|uniref:inositol monophosphatase family protein n=1 Tax=Puerhibacterium puerhi TaxID=2692623 RepID=UPI001357BC07|nr:inositol monophosphatase family protein [Puerhibacterium puerhi]
MTSSIESVATAAVDLALSILRDGTTGGRTYKTDRDFATATDYAIEDAVRSFLARETPEIGFLGEERGAEGSTERYWCLDPIDGTTNFSRGIPNFGVSLALIEGDQPTFGTIALPMHRERYITRNGGAYLNEERITVSTTTELRDAVVSMGDFATGEGSAEKNRRRLGMMARLADSVGRIRMLGSAATDLAWLAAGRLDAVVIDANRPWDVAAGVALAYAVSATVTQVDAQPYGLSGSSLVVGAPMVHERLIGALAPGREAPSSSDPR